MFVFLRRVPFEAYIWFLGLVYLALFSEVGGPDLCLMHRLGIPYCPGCGLGRAIGRLLRGDIAGSLSLHPLAIPAVLILAHRIACLLRAAARGVPSEMLCRQEEATIGEHI